MIIIYNILHVLYRVHTECETMSRRSKNPTVLAYIDVNAPLRQPMTGMMPRRGVPLV